MRKVHISKEYLHQSYVIDDINVSDIAKKFDCTKEVVYRRLREFGYIKLKKELKIKNKEKYKDRDWLYQKYIVENLSPVEIAKLLGYPNRLGSKRVDYYRSKFGFKKSKKKSDEAKIRASKETCRERYGVDCTLLDQDIKEKTRKTNIEKYGHEHPMKANSVKEKRKRTYLEKYGVTYPSISKNIQNKILDTKIENNVIFSIDEKPISYYAKEKGVTAVAIANLLRKIDPDRMSFSRQEVDGFYIEHITRVEQFAQDLFETKKYDRFFDLDNFPEIKYRPDFKFSEKTALNVDGLYWHSELQKDKKYHFNMRKEYEESGLRILQFREHEIFNKSKIVLSITNNALGQTKVRIGARKTDVRVVPHKEASVFLNQYHLKGSRKARHVGLYYKDELVQIFSYKIYGKRLKAERLCGKAGYSIMGGFSKLEAHLIRKYPDIKKIQYWVDLRYGTGYFLNNLGYEHIKDTLGWEWTDFSETYNRLQCRANMDDRRLSQAEHAEELGWVKIYDAGQRLYEKIL